MTNNNNSTQPAIPFGSFLWQALMGQLLSDGHVEQISAKSARLSWSFGHKSLDYALWVFSLFSAFCSDNGLYTLKSGQHRLKSLSQPGFLPYFRLFYTPNVSGALVKVVPPVVLEFMSFVMLAHLIMGDGSWSHREGTVFIYTNSFARSECLLLAGALTHKLGVKTTVRKDKIGKNGEQQYRLAVSKSSVGALQLGVKPFMHTSLLYRVGLLWPNTWPLYSRHNPLLRAPGPLKLI